MNTALLKAIENRSRNTSSHSKGEAHALFKALRNKKKLPTFERKYRPKDPTYAKMSIEEYEKKYN